MELRTILTEVTAGVLVITLNRPEKLNALNREMLGELAQLIRYAEGNQAIKVVIITGSGPKAFVAGADIAEFAEFSQAQAKDLSQSNQENVFNAIENADKPWIAAINGFALGGGLELALCCHLRVASENAWLGLPELSLGLIPGYGGTQRLTRIAGVTKAMEMILCGTQINSIEALQFGIVNKITSAQDLLSQTLALAENIKLRAPLALTAAIKAINTASLNPARGFNVESDAFSRLFDSQDFHEGTRAFLEKRKAVFTGT